jgi:hypothetical protein
MSSWERDAAGDVGTATGGAAVLPERRRGTGLGLSSRLQGEAAPGELVVTSRSGIPIIAPEIQLLYEAKHHLDKNEHDFRETLGSLSERQRRWLREALGIVHPGDPWLEHLG